MTETQQLIEQVRIKMNGATDYKIAQALDLHTQRVSEFVRGKGTADPYACAKIAEALGRDPLAVIAQVEAEAAKTEKKRAYWRSFFSSMKRRAHGVVWLATFLSLGAGQPVGSGGSPTTTSHNDELRQRRENRQRDPKRRKAA